MDEDGVRELNIRVVVDKKSKSIVVKDDAGNERPLKSVLVVGGDFERQNYYLFGEGASADLGWALANTYRYARVSKRPQDSCYLRMFNHFLRWMAQYFGWTRDSDMDTEELLRRWDEEDAEKAEAREKKACH